MLEHLKQRRPAAAVLGTYLALYDKAFPDYRNEVSRIAGNAIQPLRSDIDITQIGIATNSGEVAAFLDNAGKDGVDAVILMSLGYTNSLSVAQPLIESDLPLIFFNTQVLRTVTSQFNDQDLLHNHGMQGVQDIAAVLVRAGRRFEMVTGLPEQPEIIEELRFRISVQCAASQIRQSHVALMGEAMPGMGDSVFDEKQYEKVFGTGIHHLPPKLLAEACRKANDTEIESIRHKDLELFDIDPSMTLSDHLRSIRQEIALRSVVNEHRLSGLTLSFDTIATYPGIETIPFYAINKLMAEGMAYGGEGDLFVTASGVIAHYLAGDVTFTEMYTMDFDNNCVLNSHMAECNWKMARKDRKPALVRRQFSLAESEPFLFFHFALEPGPVTLFDLTMTSEAQFHFITFQCEVDDLPACEGLDRPNFRLRFRRDLRQVLNEYSLLGGGHHLNLVYGCHTNGFKALAEIFNCKFTSIEA